MTLEESMSAIESVLFAAPDAVPIARLAEVLDISEEKVGEAIDALDASLRESDRGLFLIGKDQSVLLSTRPENARFVEAFFRLEREGPLSRAALETLSIVAYRGPISHAEVESIRGVNSSLSLRNLLLRGLVDRKENPLDARSALYSPSFQFLESLGLSDISELPEYESLSRDEQLPDAEGEVVVKENTIVV